MATTWHIDASRIAMEARRNMAKSMLGFLEKSPILFAMFFNLGITTLSNIATKPSFLVWGNQPTEVCVAQHKEAYPMSSAPPPPPTALHVAAMVMAAMTTATVTTAAGAAAPTTTVGASTATTAAATTATAVDTNIKQQSTKSGSGRLGGGGGRLHDVADSGDNDDCSGSGDGGGNGCGRGFWWRRGGVCRDGCVRCCQMVVTRKLQNSFGDFTQLRGAMFLTLS